MANKGNRFRRLLRLIALLQRCPGLTSQELSEHLGITDRSVFRDLNTLRDGGVPVSRPISNEGYRLGDEFRMPRLALTPEERLAFESIPQLLATRIGQPLVRTMLAALIKIQIALPDCDGEQSHTDNGRCRYLSASPADVAVVSDDERIFSVLRQGIEDARVCRLAYLPAGNEPLLQIDFEPIHLHFWNRAWYAIGESKQHAERRILKVSRIQEISLLQHGFTSPSDFSIDRFLRNAWGLQHREDDRRVVLRFSPRVARNVADVTWHRTQQTEFDDDGTLRVEFTVSGIEEICWWIAGYADQVEVVEPDDLRTRLRDMCTRASSIHHGALDPKENWRAQQTTFNDDPLRTVGESQPTGRRKVVDADVVVRHDLPIDRGEIGGESAAREETEGL